MVKKIIAFSILLLLLLSCNNKNFIESKNYKNKEKRIEVLEKYFKLKSEIVDTEYELYDVNLNNRSIPGPTDRDFKIIIKVEKSNLKYWYEPNIIPSFPINYNWAKKLINENFKISGVNKQYSDINKKMIIFEETGVILIRIVQH